MGQYILDGKSLARVKSHHFIKKILKFWSVRIITLADLLVSLPEELISTSSDQTIVRILNVSLVERRSLRDHNEKNDTSSEKIYTRSSVRLVQMDFRGHVTFSSKN